MGQMIRVRDVSESRSDDTTVDVEFGPRPSDEAEVHRRLAAELFNRVWSLLEKIFFADLATIPPRPEATAS